LTATIISIFAYNALSHSKIDAIIAEHSSGLDTLRSQVIGKFEQIERDLRMLENLPPIEGIERASNKQNYDDLDLSTGDQWKSRLTKNFVSILRQRPEYLQIRLISAENNGVELVIVRQELGGEIRAVLDLRQRANAPYFYHSLSIRPGEIYYSEIDTTNRFMTNERNPVTILSISTPVGSKAETPFGFIIIDLNYPKLMEDILNKISWGYQHYLIDHNGNFLSHTISNK